MTELDPKAFADLLSGYCLDVQAGETVLVRSTSLAAPLLLELQRSVLDREAWPLLRVELPGQTRAFYEHARDRHLDDYPDLTLTEAKKIDALLGIQAPADTHELAGVDPERITRYARARRPIREATMKKRWCGTLWPTAALAAQAGLALEEAKGIDANLGIRASGDVRELVGVDPERIARLARANRPVREAIMKKRWCSTLWPTEALAQQAGLSLGAFAAFVGRALFLDR